ncbi:MAG: ATP-binding protein [Gemmatimonadota bacterium]|nr:ATP-binding protein [Gemmatimonadota bacterium]
MPAALLAAAVTAVTLTTLGGISLYTARRIVERDAADRAVTAVVAIARALANADTRSDTARALAALDGALPDAIVREIATVHGDSMTVVATSIAASDADHLAPASRAGLTIAVQQDVREAWDAGTTAAAERALAQGGGGALRLWEPVHDSTGRVAGAVGALILPAHFNRQFDADIRDATIAGVAVILALSLLAGISRYRSEFSREQSNAQLVAAKEAAEDIARSRGEFLANMSHEIRTPLHGVLGMTEAMLAAPHTEADRRSLEVINRSASGLLGILNDILDYSKLEAGRVDLVNAPFDPRALIDDVTDLFAVRAEEKGLDLAARETARCDAWPVGDAARIRQVLLNLVGNAVKFTEKGSVEVELSTVSIGRQTVVLRVAVRDTGIGIAQEKQDRVFEQFSQAEGSTSRRFGGTGLGLTISRQLVMLMGGTISVSSVPDQGSEFVVNVQLPAAHARPERPTGPRLPAGTRVIACTPLAATRAALGEMCARERLAVEPCATAAEAGTLLRKGDRYAAVFCDAGPLDGPHPLSGFGVPLILLTTVHRPLNNSTLSMAGAAAQLRRPVRQDHLSEILASLATGALRNPSSSEAPTASAAATPQAIAATAPAARPATPPDPTAAGGTSPAAPPAATEAGRGADAASILVVDDVELNLVVAKAMLASLGVEVRTASGGEAALDLLSHDRVDLVLMDCHMPGLDGYEVTRRVRASPGPNRETPIIALSASAFAADKDRAMASGMNDFATKPIELAALRALLDRWTQAVRA